VTEIIYILAIAFALKWAISNAIEYYRKEEKEKRLEKKFRMTILNHDPNQHQYQMKFARR